MNENDHATGPRGASDDATDSGRRMASGAKSAFPTDRDAGSAPSAAGHVPPRPDMAWIPGGTFLMGANDFYAEERPVRAVRVSGFWIDRYPVTNEQFARFVAATSYVTAAERPPDPARYPGAPPELLVAGSMVFTPTAGPVDLDGGATWWQWTPGASWRRPRGPAGSGDDLRRHPVVHVTLEDVVAYCAWAGTGLPTEAEWECAARGGLERAVFAWGDEERPGGACMANTWQGHFPWWNTEEDGYAFTSPVGSYPANGYGVFDMAGNVWEWTADWYRVAQSTDSGGTWRRPEYSGGAERDPSLDPHRVPLRFPRKVVKGGSHLCAPRYCFRYRPAARRPHDVDTAMSHLGFRTVVRAPC